MVVTPDKQVTVSVTLNGVVQVQTVGTLKGLGPPVPVTKPVVS